MREAELFDGTVLEFPDDTPDDVIERVAREQTRVRQPAFGRYPGSGRDIAGPTEDVRPRPQEATEDELAGAREPAFGVYPQPRRDLVGPQPDLGLPARPRGAGVMFEPAGPEGAGQRERERAAAQMDVDLAKARERGRISELPPVSAAERLGKAVSGPAMLRGAAQGYADIGGQMWGLLEAAADQIPGAEGAADFARAARKSAIEFAAAVPGPRQMEPGAAVSEFVQAGTRGALANAPALVVGAAAGLPASMATFYAQSFGDQYGQGRDAGLRPGEALLRAMAVSIPEVATELLPTERFLRMGAAAAAGRIESAFKAWAQAAIAEVPGEELNTVAAFLLDKLPATGLNPDAGPAELRQQLAETLYQTIAQTAVMGGAGVGGALVRRPRGGGAPPEPDAGQMMRERGFDMAARAVDREQRARAIEDAAILAAKKPADVVDAAVRAAARPDAAMPAIEAALQQTSDAELLSRVAGQVVAEGPRGTIAPQQEMQPMQPAGAAGAEILPGMPREVHARAPAEAQGPAGARPEEGSLAGLRGRVQTPEEARAAALRGLRPEERADASRRLQQIAAGALEVSGVPSEAPSSVDAAAAEAATSPENDLLEPTDAQKEAGNYQMGHAVVAGLNISIENPAGSTRSGVSPEGKPWSTEMAHHYGYIRGTVGRDKDHIDVFVAPGTPDTYAGPVYIVDQRDPKTGKFDEHKVLLGFPSLQAAADAYRANYEPGWTGMRTLSEVPMADFKAWLESGRTREPFDPAAFDERVERLEKAAGEQVGLAGREQQREQMVLQAPEAAEPAEQVVPQATTAPAVPALPQRMFVERSGQRFEVGSLQEASRKWEEFRDQTGAGMSEIGNGVPVVDETGRQVARISYNGTVWPPGAYRPGQKPLYAPRTAAPKEVEHARTVRSDQAQPTGEERRPAPGREAEAVEDRGRTDLQRDQEAGRGPGDREAQGQGPPREEVAQREKGAPAFAKGDRVVIKTGDGEGRHGVVTEVETLVMRPIFGRGEESRSHYFTVRSDGGAVFSALSESSLERESGEAPAVVPDVEFQGRRQPIEDLRRRLPMERKALDSVRGQLARSRVEASKRAHRERIVHLEKRIAEMQQAIAAWEAEHGAAEAAPAPPAPAAPVIAGAPRITVSETKHGKTGAPLWVAKMAGRVERDVYERIARMAQQRGGKWSKWTKGFEFSNAEAARNFATDVNGTPTAAPQARLAEITEEAADLRRATVARAREIAARLTGSERAEVEALAAGAARTPDAELAALGETLDNWERRATERAEPLTVAPKEPAPRLEGPREAPPRRERPREVRDVEAEATRAAYFTPGNVVRSYFGFDEVLEYRPAATPGESWQVLVHEVKQDVDKGWIRVGKPQDARWHMTQPTSRELEQGPVTRLDYVPGAMVLYSAPRADGQPFANAPDRGRRPVEAPQPAPVPAQIEGPAAEPPAAEAATWWDKELTTEGRRRMLEAIGITSLPAAVKWRHVPAGMQAALLSEKGQVDLGEPPAQTERGGTDETAGDVRQAEGIGGEGAAAAGAAAVPALEARRRPGGIPEGARGPDERDVRDAGRPGGREGGAEPVAVPAGGAAAQPGAERGGRGGDRAGGGVRARVGQDFRAGPEGITRRGSWYDTAARNLDIIELSKRIEAEGRQATPDEQALLAQYTGWGASEMRQQVFPTPYEYQRRDNPDILFVPENARDDRWRKLSERARALMTLEEQREALSSSQYAHYTSDKIVRSIYAALDRMGFTGGKIVEPGMGSGLFATLMPQGMYEQSRYTGIERDILTGRIAKLLLPAQNVIVGDFVRTKLPRDYFDAAIGNPPFASIRITGDPAYKKHRFLLHDYFFAKTIDSVRPGGLLVFVTSSGTMDKRGDAARRYLAERADLLGAIRLPQTAFLANAGTEVVTDVLFLRRRAPDEQAGGESWIGVEEVPIEGAAPALVNEYFVRHPEMVLGKHSRAGTQYQRDSYTVLPLEGDIEEHFAAAAERLPAGVYTERPKRAAESTQAAVERDFNPKAKKEGGLYKAEDGSLRVLQEGSGVAVDVALGRAVSQKERQFLTDYLGLRDSVKEAQSAQWNDANWEAALKKLQREYAAFVKKHGHIQTFTTSVKIEKDDDGNDVEVPTKRYKFMSLLRRADVEYSLVWGLERIRDDVDIVQGDMLLGRTIAKPVPPVIKGPGDALAVSLDALGRLDLADIAQRLGTDRAGAIEQLGELIYEVPGGDWEMADAYLSGDVVTKLGEAEIAARDDSRFRRNVEALRAVQPLPLGPDRITVRLGASWVPEEVVVRFAAEVLGSQTRIAYSPQANAWNVEGGNLRTRDVTSEWGMAGKPPLAILEAILNNRSLVIRKRVDAETERTVVDDESTAKLNDIAQKMRDRFSAWVWEDADRTGQLLDLYNSRFNNLAPRVFDGKHLSMPGVSLKISLLPHQKRMIWRAIQTGNVYAAHAVGAGKTFGSIGATMEQKRLGLISKPMFVVPNHMLGQFSAEFKEMYPTANIMVADQDNFTGDQRRRFVAQAALNAPDAIVITHSAFGLVPMSQGFYGRYIERAIKEIQGALADIPKTERLTRRQLQQRLETLQRRLEGRINQDKADKAVTFEELGVDYLVVDEAHLFRKLDFFTNRTGKELKGISPLGSAMAMDLHMKIEHLAERRAGRSHMFLSGTPVTNTMGELYTIQRFFDPDGMVNDGVDHFDAWANSYGEMKAGFERNAAGDYEVVSRFAKLVNVPELMARVRTFMDVLTSDQLGDLVKRPNLDEGRPQNIIVKPSPELERYMKGPLRERIERSRKWKPTQSQPNNPDPLIAIIGDARVATLDARFFAPGLPNDPGSKLNRMIDEIVADYRRYADLEFTDNHGKPEAVRGGTQIVFSAIGFGAAVRGRGFDPRAWITKRLREAGIPAQEIAWAEDLDSDAKKSKTQADMRAGRVKILIGSPAKMGTGLNVQKRLRVLHFLAPPWYPADVEQPHGRILRQGNQNQNVAIKWYSTEGTYDSTQWDMVARKSKFIAAAMSGDNKVRALEDVSEVSAYELASALASGDQRVMQIAGLSADIERLERLRGAHHTEQANLRGRNRDAEASAGNLMIRIERMRPAVETHKSLWGDAFVAKVGDREFRRRSEFGDAVAAAANAFRDERIAAKKTGRQAIGEIGGRPIVVDVAHIAGNEATVYLDVEVAAAVGRNAALTENVTTSSKGSFDGGQELGEAIVRTFNGIPRRLERAKEELLEVEANLARYRRMLGVPFADERVLNEKIAERAQLQAQLAAEGKEVEQISNPEGREFNADPLNNPQVEQGRVDYRGADAQLLGRQPTADAAGRARVGGGATTVRTDVARQIVGALKARPSVIAKTIADEFERGEATALTGKVVRGPQDVAALAQVWRDPRFETLRYVFVRREKGGDRVVHATAVSSRLPGSAAAFPSGISGIRAGAAWLWKQMRDSDADGYYLLHNHPSGEPTASAADIGLTIAIDQQIPGFRGHVIIDGGKYGLIVRDPKDPKRMQHSVVPLPVQWKNDPLLTPPAGKASEFLGRVIGAAGHVAAIGKAIARSDMVGIVGQSGYAGVRLLAEAPPRLFDDFGKAAAWLRRLATSTGSNQMFVWVPAEPGQQRAENFARLIREGFMADAVIDTGGPLMSTWDQLVFEMRNPPIAGKTFGRDITYARLARQPEIGPTWYSALERGVEGIDARAMGAGDWAMRIRSLSGVKSDEIEWSGIREWLGMQAPGKITKDRVLDYLRANGVRVEETMLGRGGGETLIDERDRLIVQLDAQGISVERDFDGTLVSVSRRSDGARFEYDGQNWVPEYGEVDAAGEITPRPLTDEQQSMALRIGEIGETEDRTGPSGTRYGEYTLPGGENYRELLLRLPEGALGTEEWRRLGWRALQETVEVNREFRSSHFDKPNILAHVRFKERTDAEGKRVLFIEELQSDWAQKGKREGFAGEGAQRSEERDALYRAARDALQRNDNLGYDSHMDALQDIRAQPDWVGSAQLSAEDRAAIRAYLDLPPLRNPPMQPPRAPFVGKTEAWVALSLKRMIRYAAENGFDRVAWTTGEQQADRYDLSKRIDQVTARLIPPAEGAEPQGNLYHVRASPRGQAAVINETVPQSKLPEFVGKELADRIIQETAASPGKSLVYNGLDLKVGGEGMRAFYDRIVPNVANDVLKKFGGGRVTTVRFSQLPDIPGTGWTSTETPGQQTLAPREQPGFDITPAMRDQALGGMAMFQPAARYGRDFASEARENLRGEAPPPAEQPAVPYRGRGTPRFDIPEETRAQRYQRYITDNLKRLEVVQEAVRAGGGRVEAFGPRDVYRAAERFPGIVTDRLDRFTRDEVEPLLQAMDAAGVTPGELALYAYAKHAPSRNRYIQSINPEFEEGGSGMTDEEAEAILLAADEQGRTRILEPLHARLMAITEGTRTLLADEGLITADQAEAWAGMWTDYVPLRGFERIDQEGARPTGGGKGFSIRGKETLAALGRESRAGQIMEQVLLARERAILRAEKNRVGKALLDLVTANPDPKLWAIDPREQRARMATITDRDEEGNPIGDPYNQVIYESRPEVGPQVFSTKVAGVEVRISLRDPLLAEAMKNLTDESVGPVLRTMSQFNSYLSRMYTGLNPTFVVLNGFRDAVTAMIQAHQYDPKLASKIVKHYRGALAASMRFEYKRVQHHGGGEPVNEWDRWFREFSQHGGRTGFMALKSLEDKVSEVQRMFRRFDPDAPLHSRAWARTMQAVELIEGVNQSIENASRLAAYRGARELGMSPAEAASVAKNITVNFNRRGQATRWIAPFFLFWNASVQGGMTAARAMKSPRVQTAVGMLTGGAVAMALMNVAIGGDDDDETAYWDKIPDYVKARNLVVMLPPGEYTMDGVDEVGTRGRYLKIPLPYGFSPFVVFGNSVVDTLRYLKDSTTGASPMKSAGRFVTSVLQSYNPAGGESFVTSVAPILQPVFQAVFNVNRWGGPLYPEPQFGRMEARAEQYFESQRGTAFQRLAEEANRLSGGNSVRDGWLSVQPAVLENTFRYFTGGAGQFVSDVIAPILEAQQTGEVTVSRLPFVRQLVGVVGEPESRRAYNELRQEAIRTLQEFKALAERDQHKDPTPAEEVLLGLAQMDESMREALSSLRRAELEAHDDTTMTRAELRKELNRIEFERRYLYNEFLRAWKHGTLQ